LQPEENLALSIAILMHDLRSPLQTITSATAHLSRVLGVPGAVQRHEEDIRLIQTAVGDMRRMIQDLLDVSAAMLGRFSVAAFPLRADRLLETASQELKLSAQTKNIDLQWWCDPGLPEVRADGDRLHQVLMNLGQNAITFTPPGGRVTLRAIRANDVIVFEVSDTGTAGAAGTWMGESNLSGVFERIRRGGEGQGVGMGIGLAIAKAIVEAHGGRIGVTTTPLAGAAFHFTVPIDAAPPEGPIRAPDGLS